MEMNRKEHWEKVYNTKELNEVGWYQEEPKTSLDFVRKINPSKESKIIDVGGGAYFFVDYLLGMEFSDITVLDISATALETVKNRLAEKSQLVKWVAEDITSYQPKEKYMIWHDRAVFHFLTEEADIKKYVKLVTESIVKKGHFILGTFSVDGPKKCSGLEITQYSEESIRETFSASFNLFESMRIDHVTPSGIKQNFIFSHLIPK